MHLVDVKGEPTTFAKLRMLVGEELVGLKTLNGLKGRRGVVLRNLGEKQLGAGKMSVPWGAVCSVPGTHKSCLLALPCHSWVDERKKIKMLYELR